MGTELAQLRPYELGDDVRHLDPAATAPHRAPARPPARARARADDRMMVESASMAFGTGLRLKSDVAEGVAATIGRLAVRRGGRVAAITAGAPVAGTSPCTL